MQNGNSFTYEGNTYKVRSVVLYELENNMTQIWMSETAGTEVFFDDGEEFRLRNSYGNILVVPSAESISISLKLTNEECRHESDTYPQGIQRRAERG